MLSPLRRPIYAISLLFLSVTAAGIAAQIPLTVTWEDKSDSETGFKVERSLDGATFSAVGTVGANVTSFTDPSVAPSTTYWYRVCAYNPTASSAFSNLASVTTGPATSQTEAVKTPGTNPARLAAVTVQALAAPWGGESLILDLSTAFAAKNLLVRAVGPGLSAYTDADTLTDPRISIAAGTTVVASNDNWGGSSALRTLFEQVGAFPLSASSKDAALVTSFSANRYTATIQGKKAGLVLAEVFDADTTDAPVGRLVRFLGRGPVGTGSAVLVAGFTISGNSPLRLLVRAVGPSLSGLQGVLRDPQLQIYRGSTLVTQNDNWGGSSALSALFKTVSASQLPASSKDAAVDVTLPPGSYTAVISGINQASGIGRIELYVVP